MGDFKETVGKFLVTAIVIFSLFTVIVIMQNDNDSAEKLIDNEVFNDSLSTLSSSIGQSTEAAEEKYGVFSSEEPKSGFGSIVLFGIVSVGKTFSNIVFGTFGAIIKLPLKVLGLPENIVNLIITWLIIVVIVGVWLLYKLGG